MSFDEYQKEAKKTADYPIIGKPIIYPTIGLAGEAGEVANKVKKIFRDGNGELTSEQKNDIAAELGDVLWYVAQIATELNLPLSEVASMNLKKLKSRKDRGQISGSGDNR